jgi:hypothetical protein
MALQSHPFYFLNGNANATAVVHFLSLDPAMWNCHSPDGNTYPGFKLF